MISRMYGYFTLSLVVLLLLVGSVTGAETGVDAWPVRDLTGTWAVMFTSPESPYAQSMTIDDDGLVCLDGETCGKVIGRSVWIRKTFYGTFCIRLTMIGAADTTATKISGLWLAYNPPSSEGPLTSYLIGSWEAYKQY